MKSLSIASLVWGLYALWLSNYGIEATKVKVTECKVENPIPGAVKLTELNVADGEITGSKLEVQQEIQSGMLTVHLTISSADGDTLLEQTVDLCSMSSNDICKNYFLGFEQPEFNEGQCPINPGIYSSSKFSVDVEDPPEGKYKGHIEVMEGPNTIVDITCESVIE